MLVLRDKVHRIVTLLVVMGVLGSVIVACAPAATPSPPPPEATATTAPEPTPMPPEPTPTEAGPPVGGELVVGLSSEPSKLDPHRTAAENGILAAMQACETLVMREADATLVPGLAASWEVSEDSTTYTFNLREGIKFHDGTDFDAAAVKYNFERILDPDTMSEYAINLLGPLSEVEVVDDHTVVVRLESPVASFLNSLAEGWLCMVSPTAAEEWGPEEFQDHFAGTGPFVIKEWKRQEHIRLERNPDYWGGPEFFGHQGLAYLDAILFKFLGEATVRSGTLEMGEILVAQAVPATDVARLEANPDIDVFVLPGPGSPVLALFNMSKPPMDDLRVRQAIEYAVDQGAISETLYEGVLGPGYGPLSPATPCYWSGVEEMYAYDQETAEDLLEEAGWVDTDGDGIRDKDGQPMVLDFPVHGGFPMSRDPAPIIQAQLREVGIEVNVMNEAVPAWLEAGRTGNQHIGMLYWTGSDPNMSLRSLFYSQNQGAFAWTRHTNSHLDELLDDGMATLDTAERCAIYQEVQKIIMEDAMVKPTNLFSAVWGVRTSAKGVSFDELNPGWFWAFDAYLEQ